ncbi:P-loop NTPase family protein [Pedobacter hartonius]|uniref:Adenylate kinase n=1 Tax=Pedobacter hartonius TaxID=425514 RepID=A0A1H3XH30_9SPHI|nr:hypothetical protein [Pedobacter hartonius]SDZ97868.1 Adenylate kinase [Pedobacter hartonius]
MKILIFGAAGAGSTTQGEDLSLVLEIPYFDTDHYFWEPASAPFTVRRDPEVRNLMLRTALSKQQSWILGGSLTNWGEEWYNIFNLAVFLYVPPLLRLERLRRREIERFGEAIFTDPERNRLFEEFMSWCAGYDDNTARGRTLAAHETWMKALTCPVLNIRSDLSIEQRRKLIMNKISNIRPQC